MGFLKFNFIIFLFRRILLITRFRDLNLREEDIVIEIKTTFFIYYLYQISKYRRDDEKLEEKIILWKNLTNH